MPQLPHNGDNREIMTDIARHHRKLGEWLMVDSGCILQDLTIYRYGEEILHLPMQVGDIPAMRAFAAHGKFAHIKISLTDHSPKMLLQKMQYAAEIGLCPEPMEEADKSEPIIIASSAGPHNGDDCCQMSS